MLVKLDLEGAEPLSLEGAKNLMDAVDSMVLVCEVNPKALRDAGYQPADLIRQLQDLKFDVRFIDEANKRLLPIQSLQTVRKGNLYRTRTNQDLANSQRFSCTSR